MTTEITRENVQGILDRNAAKAKSKEEVMYEQERKLRLHINGNHATKSKNESQRAKNESQRAQKEQEAREAELAKRQERRAELAQEGNECYAWYQFMFMVFVPLILASTLVSLAGTAPIAIPLLIIMAAYTATILLTAIKAFFPKPSLSYLKTVATRILFMERS